MPAPSYVNSDSVYTDGTGSGSISPPAGTSASDVVIWFAKMEGTYTDPPGWTVLGTSTSSASTLAVFARTGLTAADGPYTIVPSVWLQGLLMVTVSGLAIGDITYTNDTPITGEFTFAEWPGTTVPADNMLIAAPWSAFRTCIAADIMTATDQPSPVQGATAYYATPSAGPFGPVTFEMSADLVFSDVPMPYLLLEGTSSEDKSTTGAINLGLVAAGSDAKAVGSVGALSLGLVVGDDVVKQGTSAGPVAVGLNIIGLAQQAGVSVGALALALAVAGSDAKVGQVAGSLGLSLNASGTVVASGSDTTTGTIALVLALLGLDAKVGSASGLTGVVLSAQGQSAKNVSTIGSIGIGLSLAGLSGELIPMIAAGMLATQERLVPLPVDSGVISLGRDLLKLAHSRGGIAR